MVAGQAPAFARVLRVPDQQNDLPAERGDDPGMARSFTLTSLAALVLIVAVLHVGREIFLPLACAVLITFALAPAVIYLRRKGLPHLASVLAVVTLAFAVIGVFVLVVVGQIGSLAQQLPSFQANIVTKLDALQAENDGNRIVARLTRMASTINSEISTTLNESEAEDAAPVKVEVIERRNAFEMLSDLLVPLVSPAATVGLVVVVVIFMLLQREDLRDRFIRLVGSHDLHRTTQVLEEAGTRVARYLLTQLLVNIIYALPIGIGLWLIGVPNAVLWGMLTLVLRFVPYIGSILAAAFPLFLAFAVSPDWSAVLWTAALFILVELVTSNLIEPWLYGTRTGVSPLAIIVAAIFWTWIWGPLGLVLSTPMTVCLVVLGRHIPQFAVFDILFGDRPVLAPHSRLYQRLLVGDVAESSYRAAGELETEYLSDFHRSVTIPALLLAQSDHGRAAMGASQEQVFARSFATFLDTLEPAVAEEQAEAEETGGVPDGAGRRLLCLGGRSALDDVAAAALAQAARAEGAEAEVLPHGALTPARFAAVTGSAADCVILNFLDPAPARGAILHLRRIKRAAPGLRVGVVLWQAPDEIAASIPQAAPSAEARAETLATGADFCVGTMDEALREAFRDVAPVALPTASPRKPARRRVAAA
jgi:predicted PurR-regulated permease PerM